MIINFIHAIGSIFIGKFIKDKKYNETKILSLGIIIRAIFILFIVLLGNKLSNMFIIVAIFCGISETLYWSTHEMIFDAIYNTQKGDLIKKCNLEEYDVEHVMFNSVLTCTSRFIGFSLILFVGLIDNMIVFKGLLAVIAILVLIYSRIIANIEREEKL